MKRNMPFLALVFIVALVIGGFLGYASRFRGTTKPEARDIKVPPAQIVGDDSPSGSQSNLGVKDKKPSSEDIRETNVPDVDPKSGEVIVWGEVKAVDVDKRILTIDQEMDDNSVQISPNVPVSKEAVIRTKSEVMSLSQLKQGDAVGIIVTKAGQARAVLIDY